MRKLLAQTRVHERKKRREKSYTRVREISSVCEITIQICEMCNVGGNKFFLKKAKGPLRAEKSC